ncbi:bifunctional proline dehydrogenase/L-glutamate gamma-semialdehyde dehydrogenase PutA [Kangiella sp. TOML190]|uniref:bifunctional proline dehydrogenase/L-glutamate gamma-semialdehyde dehydrogenase PutA n=1 Tax=Kangiella sp. TOML190 TaxID=2931351 RepID=UPI00203B016C|nr:bifunctional proline dehydrogenase/L-glutamate gamma-semialdehyde dehydrogenase PutA [Kangiella sp. TOML190]
MFKASQILAQAPLDLEQWQQVITNNYQVDESAYLEELLELATPDQGTINTITKQASQLVEEIRGSGKSKEGVEAFLQQYSLSTKEGVILMCLAEALLRIPDSKVANSLIRDKLSEADWKKHAGESESMLVNASTWGLMLTGKIVDVDQDGDGKPDTMLGGLVSKFGEPVIRNAMNQAMKIMGRQFVLGRNIEEAMQRGQKSVEKGYTHSFDMLGEAAFTADDARKYFEAYSKAINEIGSAKTQDGQLAPSISIKLSALHPRYEVAQKDRVLTEMVSVVKTLAKQARELDVAITIDAEEADRLELSLDIFEAVFDSDICRGWDGFGMVVQAYSKRALPVLGWLDALSKKHQRRIPLRLVKGAYWDSEIKWSQQAGLASYPVFTRKAATDVSYLACAKFILNTESSFYPQFATHNAQTVFSIMQMAGERRDFEFQRLHGMGEVLYDLILKQYPGLRCRIYAPVGNHKDLLPYLVRRLLENGANTSFVHQLVDKNTPVIDLVEHPSIVLKAYPTLHNNRIPLPPEIYAQEGVRPRLNSAGTNLHINSEIEPFMQKVASHLNEQWHAKPIINGKELSSTQENIYCPYDQSHQIGTKHKADEKQALEALAVAQKSFIAWDMTPAEKRAEVLDTIADLFEQHKHELIALCSRDGGKTMQDSIDEVREAVDFCRYYANRARQDFAQETSLPGPTGESNDLYLQGRGVFACISPWNFPLAIFTGQVVAALVAGNTVLAKPADQTTLVAYRAIQLMHQAGIPKGVLQFVPCRGSTFGKTVLSDPRIAGVAFTGSTDTAHTINRTLAARDSVIAPLIAETGGQNAMIVDSSALPEQVIEDVIHSAFTSAGQRCSALRLLYVQEDIAPRIIEVLSGAMQELKIGDPTKLKTDLGPVIDQAAKEELLSHVQELKAAGKLIAETPMPSDLADGHFIAPTAFKIGSINDLTQEWFGPVLHLVTYKAKELDKVIAQINNYGYGLTLGIHSRNEKTATYIDKRVRVGNVYINRNMIGATVGVQPFGGQGLSGTGPKAGGPHYLHRFATEHTRTNNTAAIGGNATLLSLGDDQ